MYLVVVDDLVPVRFAFVRSDEIGQFVFLEEISGDVGPEIGSGPAQSVRDASFRRLRVAPQDVEYLGNKINFRSISFAISM